MTQTPPVFYVDVLSQAAIKALSDWIPMLAEMKAEIASLSHKIDLYEAKIEELESKVGQSQENATETIFGRKAYYKKLAEEVEDELINGPKVA
jgi:predicted RNase H-like nuclease (RuvC/YqgF family)